MNSREELDEQQELIQALAEIVEELGWVIGIPQEEGSTNTVQGLIIGTEEFVMSVVEQTQQEVETIEFDSIPGSTSKKQVH